MRRPLAGSICWCRCRSNPSLLAGTASAHSQSPQRNACNYTKRQHSQRAALADCLARRFRIIGLLADCTRYADAGGRSAIASTWRAACAQGIGLRARWARLTLPPVRRYLVDTGFAAVPFGVWLLSWLAWRAGSTGCTDKHCVFAVRAKNRSARNTLRQRWIWMCARPASYTPATSNCNVRTANI